MFGARKAQREKDSAARRLLQPKLKPKRILTAALIAPALGFALMTPSLAFAAETAGLTTQCMDPGILTLDSGSVAEGSDSLDSSTTETVFVPTDAGAAYAEVYNGSGTSVTTGNSTSSSAYVIANTVSNSNDSIDSIVVSVNYDGNVYANTQTSDQLANKNRSNQTGNQMMNENDGASASLLMSDSVEKDTNSDVSGIEKTSNIASENIDETSLGLVVPFSQEALELINNERAASDDTLQTEEALQTEETLQTAETVQSADIHFNASEGGSVAPGHKYSKPSQTSSIYSEHFEDAKSGSSQGATAFADEGYHFVKWVYTDTQNEVSTSDYYKPTRPGTGWPTELSVTAVFERNTYTVILDANGGTPATSEASSSPVKVTVVAGTDSKLPINGGSVVNYANKGCGLSGWNVVRNPGAAGTTGSYFIADGQVLDSKTEYWLQTLGYLNLDWATNPNPTVKLFAQWSPGQVTYTYTSSEGGTIEPNVSTLTADDTMSTETIDALTGSHSNNSKSEGPDGATATADSYYHFDKWIKTAGDDASALTDEAAANAKLDTASIKSASYYAEEAGTAATYHGMSFKAAFAPNTYLFAYEANGGSGSMADMQLTHAGSGAIAASGVTRDGYTLTGWNTTSNGIGRTFTLGQTIDADVLDELMGQGMLSDKDGSKVTLYAQWEKAAVPDPEPEPDPEPQPDEPDDNGNKGKGDNTGDNGGKTTPDTPKTPSSNGPTDNGGNSGAGGKNAGTGSTTSNAGNAGKTTTGTNGSFASAAVRTITALPAKVQDVIESIDDALVGEADDSATDNSEENTQTGSLASTAERDGSAAIVISDAAASSARQGSTGGLSQMSAPDAVSAVGEAVGTIAAVGAIAGIVGIGASIAGTTIIGAAAVGTASTAGLSSAADLAADIAANAAGAGADVIVAGKKKKKDEDDDEPQQ